MTEPEIVILCQGCNQPIRRGEVGVVEIGEGKAVIEDEDFCGLEDCEGVWYGHKHCLPSFLKKLEKELAQENNLCACCGGLNPAVDETDLCRKCR